MTFKTDQEKFWAGDFGTDYINRNQSDKLLSSNINFFCKALRAANKLKSCIEFGANIGMNLKVLQLLYPKIDAHAIEINTEASKKLSKIIAKDKIKNESILDFIPKRQWDLTFTKGVLIHINPDELGNVYDKLVDSCGHYLLIAEYYNPTPVSIPYRNHNDRLFKRDFAGEIMGRHPNLQLLDYGFSYHRDLNFPQDDITWFLMEKK
ncbi:MAG: pseudaminic acid biosynthesis-associated methylase [Desulfomicrobium sp.]|nr:pseudaminic acid biosynthesis-associated methylase [Desulfomicrobium sp.]